jgi:putative transcriptional regulator
VNIHHHLDEATILAYAAGTLDEALSVVAASHIAWCPHCRTAVRQAEALGGEILTGLEPANVSDDCRARTLGLLDQATLHRFPAAPKPAHGLPAPLGRLLGASSLQDVKWRKKAPGLAMFDIKLSSAARGHVWLMRIGPGKAMPEHGHGGEEMTMILSGAYRDVFGRFAKGDIADLDEEIEHRPIVEAKEPCICLVATEAPTRFKSWPARLLQPLIGI